MAFDLTLEIDIFSGASYGWWFCTWWDGFNWFDKGLFQINKNALRLNYDKSRFYVLSMIILITMISHQWFAFITRHNLWKHCLFLYHQYDFIPWPGSLKLVSLLQIKEIWKIREGIAEALMHDGVVYKVLVPLRFKSQFYFIQVDSTFQISSIMFFLSTFKFSLFFLHFCSMISLYLCPVCMTSLLTWGQDSIKRPSVSLVMDI